MGIAEEGLDAEGFLEPVMFGELGSVVEADGFAHRLWKFAELACDHPGGKHGFPIDRMLNDAEAGLPFDEGPATLGHIGANSMKSASQWPGDLRGHQTSIMAVIWAIARRCLMKLAGLPLWASVGALV